MSHVESIPVINGTDATPVIAQAWIHGGELLAQTEDNELIVLARFMEPTVVPHAPTRRKRRKKKEAQLNAEAEMPAPATFVAADD